MHVSEQDLWGSVWTDEDRGWMQDVLSNVLQMYQEALLYKIVTPKPLRFEIVGFAYCVAE